MNYQKYKAEHNEYQKKYHKEWRKRPIGDGPGERRITHGYGGSVAGCKCEICRKAKADYARSRRHRKQAAIIGTDFLDVVSRTHRKGLPRREHKKYPYRTMEVGDSFLFPCTDLDQMDWAQRTVAQAWRRMAPRKFTTRRVKDGIRVWRIE